MILTILFVAFYVLIPLTIAAYVVYRLIRQVVWRASDVRLINNLMAISKELRTDPQGAIQKLGDLSRSQNPRKVHIPALSLFYFTLLDVRGGLSNGEVTLSNSRELQRFLAETIDHGIKSLFGERSDFFVALSNLVLLSLQGKEFTPLSAREINIEDSDQEIEMMKQFRQHIDEIPYHAHGPKIQDWLIKFQNRDRWKTIPANKIFIVFYINMKIKRSLIFESRINHYGLPESGKISDNHRVVPAEIRSSIPSLMLSILTDLENFSFESLMRTIENDHHFEKLQYASINVDPT
jgi:hypothetical protein